MELLRERITKEGKYLGNGILKVDSFMNHQIDPVLMQSIGEELAQRFRGLNPNKILTAEASGIAPSLATAMVLKIPVIFARKHRPVTMIAETIQEKASSHTHGKAVELLVSREYLSVNDRVVIIDDFLATANTILALVKLVEHSGAKLIGIGAVIEKAFENGRSHLQYLDVPVESLASISDFVNGQITFT